MEEKKLFLLDAYALIYRAYYALIRAPRVTSKGFNTSAIFGFCNTIDEVIRKENPTHMAVCFDPAGGKTFRHELYPEYKAQREKQPEDITLAVPFIKEIIEAYRIPVIEIVGYEADDVIGTLSRRAEAEGFTTYMMTPDKDYGQLVTDRVLMYRPALKGQGFEIRGPQQVCERYGIESPRQVIDLFALEGDASDNIPGCPGVGEKTASKLICEWGSVENLLGNVENLKGALQRKIADNAEQILFSKMLVTIKTDVPVEIGIESLKRCEPDYDRLRRVFTELEFKSFLSRLPGSAPSAPIEAPKPMQQSLFDDFDAPAPTAPAIKITKTTTHRLSSAEEINKAIDSIREKKHIGLAIWAVGEEAMTAIPRGIALSAAEGDALYFDLPADPATRSEVAAMLRPLFDAGERTIISHDVKRDIIILKNLGIKWRCGYFDTAVAHYLLQPEMRHRLEDVALSALSYNLSTPVDYTVKSVGNLSSFAAETIFGERAALMIPLRESLIETLSKESLLKLYDEIESPMVRVLAQMEMAGVRINVDELATQSRQLTARLGEIERKCHELAGHPFNIGSPRQVGDVLFDELKIDTSAKRTKNGSYSTTEEILEKYRRSHEIVDLILKYRGINKLLSTYINALPTLINPVTGKIHTTYNQTVTATGRISSTNPNLQNIPVRTDDGREIRRAFIPDHGDLMLSADYSQIELRLMADLSADPDMVEAFAEGHDIHRSTAAKIYKVPLEDVSDTQRRNAKTANFGIIYGISAFGLSERLDIPRSEAKMLIDGYFESYPHIKQYISEAIEKAREKGYVETIMGRKRFLPDITSRNAVVRAYAERNAVNAPLQGSAADIIKIAMIRIYDEMRSRMMRSRMIMQVHDELIFNVVPDELATLQEIVTRQMEGAYSGNVRLEVSSGVGANWLEAH